MRNPQRNESRKPEEASAAAHHHMMITPGTQAGRPTGYMAWGRRKGRIALPSATRCNVQYNMGYPPAQATKESGAFSRVRKADAGSSRRVQERCPRTHVARYAQHGAQWRHPYPTGERCGCYEPMGDWVNGMGQLITNC